MKQYKSPELLIVDISDDLLTITSGGVLDESGNDIIFDGSTIFS